MGGISGHLLGFISLLMIVNAVHVECTSLTMTTNSHQDALPV